MDPDPDREGENGSGTDPGSIKSSQNKWDKNLVFSTIFYYIYNI